MNDAYAPNSEAFADDPASTHFEASIEFAPLSKKRSWGRAALSEAWDTLAPNASVFVGPSIAKHEGEVLITYRKSGETLVTYPFTYDREAATFKAQVEEQLNSLTVAEFRKVHDPAFWAQEAAEEQADEALNDAAEAHYQAEASVVWAEYYAHQKNTDRKIR